jgi:23S rRNA pseudouridine2605 synthase
MAEERLQKILAHAGLASRRKAEQYILEGRVTVNGAIANELGTKADLDRDKIKVDGRLIRTSEKHVYILMNKPREVVTTVADPQGRRTVIHLLGHAIKERVFPVGRLDYQSEGLLLLTNDGELTNRLLHPSRHVEKVYLAKTNGPLTEQQLQDFRSGIPLEGRRTAPARIKMVRQGENPCYEVSITEGRQNQIRNMFKCLGRLVEKLRRVRMGPLTLAHVPIGAFRYLTDHEVAALREATGAAHTGVPRTRDSRR